MSIWGQCDTKHNHTHTAGPVRECVPSGHLDLLRLCDRTEAETGSWEQDVHSSPKANLFSRYSASNCCCCCYETRCSCSHAHCNCSETLLMAFLVAFGQASLLVSATQRPIKTTPCGQWHLQGSVHLRWFSSGCLTIFNFHNFYEWLSLCIAIITQKKLGKLKMFKQQTVTLLWTTWYGLT